MLIIVQIIEIFLLTGITGGVESQKDECKGALARCLDALPLEGPGGLPASKEQVANLCNSYKAGNECVESWSRKCLPEERQKAARQQRQGVMLFMGLLCDDESFKKGYLNHTNCFRSVSGDWNRCVDAYRLASAEADGARAGGHGSVSGQINICCASYGFNRCISQASRAKCTKEAAMMLRRISESLTADSDKSARCAIINTEVCYNGSDGSRSGVSILMFHAVALFLWFIAVRINK